jgi:hypothetical protein
MRWPTRNPASGSAFEHPARGVSALDAGRPQRAFTAAILAENDGKPARERLTLIRVFEQLRGMGYEGGYDTVRRYARGWRREHSIATAAAFVPLSFAPGEAYQFDWSHEIVLINGTTVTVKSPTFGCATRGCCSPVLIRVRRRRWCSTPMTGRSPSSGAPAHAASTTT